MGVRSTVCMYGDVTNLWMGMLETAQHYAVLQISGEVLFYV